MNHIAINVRRLRLSKGLTQQDLANQAGVSRPTISALEDVSGEGNPSLRTLKKVSDALDTDLPLLMEAKNLPTQVRFRALQEFKSREQVLVDAIHAYDMYRMLEDATGNRLGSGTRLRNFCQENTAPDDLKGVERARFMARRLRDDILIPTGAIPRITALIEHLDVRIITIPYHADAFGLSFISSDFNPVIVVNMSERITVERWIFSAAHELGHLILHWDKDVSFEDSTELIDQENEANHFAAELLLPTLDFKSMWETMEGELLLDKVMAIKRRYVVSYQTVLHRVASLEKSDYGAVLDDFLKQYEIRYGVRLTRKEEGAIRAHPRNYDPNIIPVGSTAEEPENAGSGSPRSNMFLPQGRMMRMLVDGIQMHKLQADDVARILYSSREDANYFVQRVLGIVD